MLLERRDLAPSRARGVPPRLPSRRPRARRWCGAARRRARLAGVARGSVLARDTGNLLTVGRRFETHALTDTLHVRAVEVRLGEPLGSMRAKSSWRPAVRRLAQDRGWRFAQHRGRTAAGSPSPWRAAPSSRRARTSSTTRHASAPARWGEADFVRAAQLGRWAEVVDDDGAPVFEGRPGTRTTSRSAARTRPLGLVPDRRLRARPARPRARSPTW